VTSFSLHQVAATQEPTTHLVAETQELAIAVTQEPATTETQELAIVVTQEPTTTETQEPIAKFIPEIQELDDLGDATIALTQETTTHSVVETQEPTIVVTQEPATAETKEPTTDFILEIQESHAQGAETLFSLHQEAETKELVVDFVATPQEPATEPQ
jgi:hypothetical protein